MLSTWNLVIAELAASLHGVPAGGVQEDGFRVRLHADAARVPHADCGGVQAQDRDHRQEARQDGKGGVKLHPPGLKAPPPPVFSNFDCEKG